MKCIYTGLLCFAVIVLSSCGKNSNIPDNNGSGGTGGNDTIITPPSSCILSTISQVNSGQGTEYALIASFNANNELSKIVIYDSVSKTQNFEVSFSYITSDSVRLNQYQYMILDADRNVIKFVTKSDMANVKSADDYVFSYSYTSGYLTTKSLYVNGSSIANFKTTYTYSNNNLISCLMTTPIAGNAKVLESVLNYNSNISGSNWIYTFPDALEGYQYSVFLDFGKHNMNVPKQITTKIYDPASATLLDTWTTQLSNYQIDGNNKILAVEASGDQQQGIAELYGKTNFYYYCK